MGFPDTLDEFVRRRCGYEALRCASALSSRRLSSTERTRPDATGLSGHDCAFAPGHSSTWDHGHPVHSAPGLLYLKNKYVVPGGRFNEMYGWDRLSAAYCGMVASNWPAEWWITSFLRLRIMVRCSMPIAPTICRVPNLLF